MTHEELISLAHYSGVLFKDFRVSEVTLLEFLAFHLISVQFELAVNVFAGISRFTESLFVEVFTQLHLGLIEDDWLPEVGLRMGEFASYSVFTGATRVEGRAHSHFHQSPMSLRLLNLRNFMSPGI